MSFSARMTAMIILGIVSIASAGDVTYDDVIKAMEKVKSYQFKETQFPKNHPPVTRQIFIKGPGVARIEDGTGHLVIDDRVRNKMLLIDPKQKKVTVITTKGPTAWKTETHEPLSFAEQYRAKRKASSKNEVLDEKNIDGKKAIGFKFIEDNKSSILWVDTETKLPIREEIEGMIDDPFVSVRKPFKTVIFEFVYNSKLDDSLFSLIPPKGYEVEKKEHDLSPPTEKGFIEGLKKSAELNGNEFPSELTLRALIGRTKKYSEIFLYQTIFFAQMQHREKYDWKYVGKGVKLGEKDKAVYWYQPGAGKAYRVVYGDLSVRDVPKEKLPTTQPMTQPAKDDENIQQAVPKRNSCCH